MLAQWQLGSLHWLGSQEYPAAAADDVGPDTLPSSCAKTPAKSERRSSA